MAQSKHANQRLTPKQDDFCHKFLELKSASAALDPSSKRDYDFTNECALGNVEEMGRGWLYRSLGK